MNTKIILSVLFALLFAGCASSTPRQIYYWNGSYTASTYDYLNETSDFYKHIDELEETVEYAYASGRKIPPGLLAHIGLLYSNIGNDQKASMYLEKEAEIFPESRAYIEFLKQQKLKKGRKNGK